MIDDYLNTGRGAPHMTATNRYTRLIGTTKADSASHESFDQPPHTLTRLSRAEWRAIAKQRIQDLHDQHQRAVNAARRRVQSNTRRVRRELRQIMQQHLADKQRWDHDQATREADAWYRAWKALRT